MSKVTGRQVGDAPPGPGTWTVGGDLTVQSKPSSRSSSVLNDLINKLPFEMHIPGGYQFCGPGTRLEKRLSLGNTGKNKLDSLCKEHDVEYTVSSELAVRHAADRRLAEGAWKRVKAKDASFGEKAAAYLVHNVMKAKTKLGMGVKCPRPKKNLKKIQFKGGVVKPIALKLKSGKIEDLKRGSKLALQAARKAIQRAGGSKKINLPRVMPIPKRGGFLPFLLPVFAGLSALGGLAGGAAGIAKAVNAAKSAQKQLQESQRHNQTMEAIAMRGNKSGSGLYLKPYKKGLGLYIQKN